MVPGKIHTVLLFYFAVCLQSQYLVIFSVIFCARNVTKYQVASCHQMGSFKVEMHRNRFRPGLRPGPHWGSSRRSPRPHSRLGRGHPLPERGAPHSPPLRPRPRRFQCLSLISGSGLSESWQSLDSCLTVV